MPTLDELGFTKNDITETILTTYSPKRTPYASAVGVRKIEDKKIGFKLFTDSKTFQNLYKQKAGVVNLVGNVEKIVKQGLSEIFQKKSEIKYKESNKLDVPHLSDYDAIVEFNVAKIKNKTISDEIGKSEMAKIMANVENIDIDNPRPRNFKRSDFLLIESSILATRVIEAINNERKSIARKKIQEIKKYLKKCEKIVPNSSRKKLISKILDYLKKEMN